MEERYYEPANGQCVCEVHREFEAKHGITVDQWYERNPTVTPWYMESCGNCSGGCTHKPEQTKPEQVKPEPKPSKPSDAYEQHDSSGLHFASFAGAVAVGAVAAEVFEHVKEKPVCNPVEEKESSSQQARYDALTAGPPMPSGKQLAIMAGVIGGGFVALAIVAFAMAASAVIVLATLAGLAALAAMTIADYAIGKVTEPSVQLPVTVVEPANVKLLTGQTVTKRRPVQLSDNLSEPIEFGKAKEQEFVHVYAKRV